MVNLSTHLIFQHPSFRLVKKYRSCILQVKYSQLFGGDDTDGLTFCGGTFYSTAVNSSVCITEQRRHDGPQPYSVLDDSFALSKESRWKRWDAPREQNR